MGLNGVVFRSLKRFEGHPLFASFAADPQTGEVCSLDRRLTDEAMGERRGCTVRIGNMMGVALLRGVLEEHGHPEGSLLARFLVEGAIPAADAPECTRRLRAPRAAARDDLRLEAFCAACLALAEAAVGEGNPIIIG